GGVVMTGLGKHTPRGLLNSGRNGACIDQCGCELFEVHFNLAAHRGAQAVHDLFESLYHYLADARIECADRAFKDDLLRDDIESGAPMDHGKTDDGRVKRPDIPRNDG